MACFLYAQNSQEDDGRQMQSIGDQLKFRQDLAQSSGVTISRAFQEARSAKRPGRALFNEMIARIEDGEADGSIAWHLDRLSRNAVDARHRAGSVQIQMYKLFADVKRGVRSKLEQGHSFTPTLFLRGKGRQVGL